MILGLRDNITARPGCVFYSNDYTGGELVTHAESCFTLVGFSELGKALIGGMDVHSALGAEMMGIGYDEFVKRLKAGDKVCKAFRQAAKAGNFGFPGGMGAVKMVLQQRKQGPDTPCACGPSQLSDGKGGFMPGYRGLRFCVLVGGRPRCGETMVTTYKDRPYPPVCLACIGAAETIRKNWYTKWPENRPYFKVVSDVTEQTGEVVQHYSKRIRGGLQFTEAANGWFQALLADIAGRAQCRVSFEQYVDESSPLFGSRSILFAHDELFGECREEVGHEVSMRVNEIMIEEFRRGCPNHAAACKAEPTLMYRWYKQAVPVCSCPLGIKCDRPGQHPGGRLIPWTPN